MFGRLPVINGIVVMPLPGGPDVDFLGDSTHIPIAAELLPWMTKPLDVDAPPEEIPEPVHPAVFTSDLENHLNAELGLEGSSNFHIRDPQAPPSLLASWKDDVPSFVRRFWQRFRPHAFPPDATLKLERALRGATLIHDYEVALQYFNPGDPQALKIVTDTLVKSPNIFQGETSGVNFHPLWRALGRHNQGALQAYWVKLLLTGGQTENSDHLATLMMTYGPSPEDIASSILQAAGWNADATKVANQIFYLDPKLFSSFFIEQLGFLVNDPETLFNTNYLAERNPRFVADLLREAAQRDGVSLQIFTQLHATHLISEETKKVILGKLVTCDPKNDAVFFKDSGLYWRTSLAKARKQLDDDIQNVALYGTNQLSTTQLMKMLRRMAFIPQNPRALEHIILAALELSDAEAAPLLITARLRNPALYDRITKQQADDNVVNLSAYRRLKNSK